MRSRQTASTSRILSAGGEVDLGTFGLAQFLGTLSAPTITVTSNDIEIAGGAFLGVYGVTNLVTLNAVNDFGVYIGDFFSELPGGIYTLGEDGDIQAANIVINALSTNVESPAPNIYVGDDEVEGTLGSEPGEWGTSSVTLNTDSSIIITGAVEYYNAAATDSLTLNAGEDIIVDTDTGSIEMYAINQFEQFYPSGQLVLNADNVWVAESPSSTSC